MRSQPPPLPTTSSVTGSAILNGSSKSAGPWKVEMAASDATKNGASIDRTGSVSLTIPSTLNSADSSPKVKIAQTMINAMAIGETKLYLKA